MAALTIRNLDPAIKERLRIRAAEHGHSMEAEARHVPRRSKRRPGLRELNLDDASGALRPVRRRRTRDPAALPCASRRPSNDLPPRHQCPFGAMRPSPVRRRMGRSATADSRSTPPAICQAEILAGIAILPEGQAARRTRIMAPPSSGKILTAASCRSTAMRHGLCGVVCAPAAKWGDRSRRPISSSRRPPAPMTPQSSPAT